MVTSRRRLGDFGERVAAARLEAAGMTIRGRNVRVPGGEIDIVALDGPDVVFVEVRTRHSQPGSAAESLTPAKLQRMWRCALAYCERELVPVECVRIDVVALDLDPAGRVVATEHLRGIDIPGE